MFVDGLRQRLWEGGEAFWGWVGRSQRSRGLDFRVFFGVEFTVVSYLCWHLHFSGEGGGGKEPNEENEENTHFYLLEFISKKIHKNIG